MSKGTLFLSYLWGMETMKSLRVYKTESAFLSYLWGMETILSFNLCVSYVSFVLILPMRNGNNIFLFQILILDSCSYPTYEEWKPRIWNRIFTRWDSSYPTYEEWKRSLSLFILSTPFCSYPTYEEWKLPIFFIFFFCFNICSYPTYEEWKLIMDR